VLKFETTPDPISEYPKSMIGSKEHISLALEAAEKSIVLMQNNGSVLPFDKTKIKKVLVVGKLANMENIGDHGSSQVRPAYIVTPLEGLINQYGSSIEFIYDDGADIAGLKKKITKAEAVIYVVGYNYDDEGEYVSRSKVTAGGDRKSLRLHEDESKLLQETGQEIRLFSFI
jgi:beta-glucosidase